MKSFDGKELYTELWDDVENPKGVVQLCHGMAEYLKRYDDFAKFLNKNGYIVFGDDHRSYGRTDNNAGICEGEYVGDTIKDLLFINDYLKEKYKGLPVVFFGHSYGSCLGQRFVQFDTGIKCCVLTGVLTVPHYIARIGQGIMAPVKAVAPKAKFGISGKKFPDEAEEPNSWLTKDVQIRREYNNDPLSGGKSSVKYYYGFMKLMADAAKPKNVCAIRDDLPIGIFCGKDDSVGNFGKGPATVYNRYKKHGKNAYLKLYENDRHEILNELDKDKVYNDILSFINKSINK